MSGLPKLIPPQSASFGTADSSGRIIIDVSWYLFLYNIYTQTLATGGTTGITQALLNSGTLPAAFTTLTSSSTTIFAGTTIPAGQVLVYQSGPLGSPSSGNLTSCTGYTYANLAGVVPTWNQNTSGNAATATNATNATNLSGSGTVSATTTGGAALIPNASNGLNSATTIISVNAATAPSSGQVLTATSPTTATWQSVTLPSGSVAPNVINSTTTIAADTSYILAGYLTLNATLILNGNLMII